MASIKKTVLITGSTRGIGLTFAEHYVRAGWNVIGTARANSKMDKLAALAPFKVVTMDTSDETTIIEAARQLEGVAIDLLINNVGIVLPSDLESGTKESLMRQFEVNSVGPILVACTLQPNLKLAAKTHDVAFVVQLSSLMGSIGSCTNATTAFFKEAGYGYSSPKAALNMITRLMAVELSASNVVAVSVQGDPLN
jgi:NAD(P)-dependent dehydrogenase (short-subunit alcohol dehydrogenase family)